MKIIKNSKYINNQTERACLVIGIAEAPGTGESMVVYRENDKLCLISYNDFLNNFEEVEELI